jgi:DNA-binding transcriptional ArsR family regulator
LAKKKAKPGKTKSDKALDQRLAKSIGHPIRIDALRILNERVASPSELAKVFGEGVPQVSFHIKELRDYGCIELVDEEPRRGAMEHYYRAVKPPLVTDAQARKLSKSTREEISTIMLQTVIAESVGALRSGSFDSRTDRHLSWMPMTLDEEGWGEVTAMLARALEEAEEIKAKSAKRLDDSDEAGVTAIVSMMGFERSKSRWS